MLCMGIEADTAGNDGWEEDNLCEQLVAEVYDEASGALVNPEQALAWEKAEVDRLRSMGTYEEISLDDAKAQRLRIISTRFLYTAAKDRARLVVQDVRHGGVLAEHYSPTPSTTALRLALTLGSAMRAPAAIMDVSGAFLYADLPCPVAVRPPKGWAKPNTVWKLHKSLYGLREAPALWASHLSKFMESIGMQQSKIGGGVYHKKVDGKLALVACVHVDDIVITGDSKHLEQAIKAIGK
jgi:hypothetical protein